jgi:hypothetical protein
VPNVQWRTPDDGQRNCPKHVEFLDKNKFGKIGASVGFIKKKLVTMHGNMNIKLGLEVKQPTDGVRGCVFNHTPSLSSPVHVSVRFAVFFRLLAVFVTVRRFVVISYATL